MKINKEELNRIFKEIKSGKQEAAQELYNKYKALVYGITFSIVKNKDDADDVTQNVFTKIIETDSDKLPVKNEATWLYTVSKNEALLFLKKKNINLEVEEAYEIPDTNDEITKIIDKETYNKLIEKLSKKEKEIISLKVIADLSFREISDLIGEKEGTTKWRYYKSVYRLKAIISNACMAIVSLVAGLVVTKYNKTKNIENNSTKDNKIDSYMNNNEQKSSNSQKEVIQNTKNSIGYEQIITNVIKEEESKEIPSNYIGYGLFGLTIVFIFTAIIIFLKKYKLKSKKKQSK